MDNDYDDDYDYTDNDDDYDDDLPAYQERDWDGGVVDKDWDDIVSDPDALQDWIDDYEPYQKTPRFPHDAKAAREASDLAETIDGKEAWVKIQEEIAEVELEWEGQGDTDYIYVAHIRKTIEVYSDVPLSEQKLVSLAVREVTLRHREGDGAIFYWSDYTARNQVEEILQQDLFRFAYFGFQAGGGGEDGFLFKVLLLAVRAVKPRVIIHVIKPYVNADDIPF